MPRISAILPLYNGIKYIKESLESIQAQTFTDWEFIIVNEYGSDDGSIEVIRDYAEKDNRIKLIQNDKKLGLAESLNVGISIANGEFIARVDVDDPSYPERFEKQLEYMEKHPEIVLCGTLQRSVLPNRSYVEEVPCLPEELKAGLLFGCEISHCSVMFRKNIFRKNDWKYDPSRLGEDYDLWTKIMFEAPIANLPEVLVDHRWGFENISLEKGEHLRQEVRETSARCLKRLGIEVSKEDLILLSGWRNRPEEFARKNIVSFLKNTYSLLSEIEEKNRTCKLFEENALKKILWKRWNWCCKTCNIFFKEISYERLIHESVEPIVSIVLPVYQAVHTLRETIDSIINQDYEQWELIIVCEYGNTDGSNQLAKFYAKYDKRIRIIENPEKLGLAESLNEGIRQSKGKYIARIDADDLSNSKRISTQVAYMDGRPQVGVTQFYQHYFGVNANDFIHRPPISAEAMKAKLLFFCDACHSTVMFRKSVLEKYQLKYDKEAQLEDYDLWIKLVKVTSFETIPEIYGEYRVWTNNISLKKNKAIQEEMCHIIAKQLEENLDLKIPERNWYLLGSWNNIFSEMNAEEKESALSELQKILLSIWKQNKKKKFYSKHELLVSLYAKWYWSKYNEPWQGEKNVSTINAAIELGSNRYNWRKKGKETVKKVLSVLQSIQIHVDAKSIEHLSNVIKDVSNDNFNHNENRIKFWTWERYQRVERRMIELEKQNTELQNALTDLRFNQNKVPYIENEKIRIVFLYQVPSFWPSWDSFYRACCEDERIDTKLVFLEETNTEKSQMVTAKEFLDSNSMDYIPFAEFSIEEFNPHVIVMQTPYDEWHRKKAHWSNVFRGQGYRIVYIPYGVEMSDTEDAHKLHFDANTIRNSWRIYTFSDKMKFDYWKYCENRKAVRALGLPRFDAYANNQKWELPQSVRKRINGRKIVLWKVHFPKIIHDNGTKLMVTPKIEEYLRFARCISEFQDLFFIFMPHPKFREMNYEPGLQDKTREMIEIIAGCDNTWIDDGEDYRISLTNADYIIVDRSAVMIEAGAIGVPVLFMTNSDYYEPVPKALKPLVDSYYQGNTCQDMLDFILQCQRGSDYKKITRKNAFNDCIPFFDGNVGLRIKEDIIKGVINNEN